MCLCKSRFRPVYPILISNFLVGQLLQPSDLCSQRTVDFQSTRPSHPQGRTPLLQLSKPPTHSRWALSSSVRETPWKYHPVLPKRFLPSCPSPGDKNAKYNVEWKTEVRLVQKGGAGTVAWDEGSEHAGRLRLELAMLCPGLWILSDVDHLSCKSCSETEVFLGLI